MSEPRPSTVIDASSEMKQIAFDVATSIRSFNSIASQQRESVAKLAVGLIEETIRLTNQAGNVGAQLKKELEGNVSEVEAALKEAESQAKKAAVSVDSTAKPGESDSREEERFVNDVLAGAAKSYNTMFNQAITESIQIDTIAQSVLTQGVATMFKLTTAILSGAIAVSESEATS